MKSKKRWVNEIVKSTLTFVLCLVLTGSFLVCFCVGSRIKASAESADSRMELVTELKDPELIYPDNAALNGYDIVFVIDNSGSLWNQQSIRDRALHTVADLAVGSDVRIGAVYFGDRVYSTYQLTSVENKDSYKDVIDRGLTQTAKDETNRNTNIGAGLKAGLALFEDQDPARERIIILFSDGINENLQKSAAFKAAADKETADQVARIREKGYPLYCAFVEKDYTDREYLRKLVNYFEDTKIYDNRMVTVSDEEIYKLADSMAGIFYDLNGGMKYKKLSLDSNGQYSFYIPDLNISQLQIYLNNSAPINSVLKDTEGKEITGWSEGDSCFYSVENPSSGEWSLEVSGSNEKVTGTIAYYTDVCVKTALTGEICRNGKTVFTANFFDRNGENIELENGAQVTADIRISDPENGEVLQNLTEIPMIVKNGSAVSDTIEITAIGDLSVRLHIGFDEFIALNYTVLKGNSVTPVSPAAKDYTGKWLGLIPAVSDNGKMQFTLNLDSYVYDPDTEVSCLNVRGTATFTEDNPLAAEIRDNKLVITADYGQWKPASVDGTVTIEDQDGLTAKLNIEGCVINIMLVYLTAFATIVFMALIIAAIVIRRRKRKDLLKSVENYMNDFAKQLELSHNLKERYMDLKSDNKVDEYQNALAKLQEMIDADHIPDQVQEILELKNAMPPAEMQNIMEEMERTAAQVNETYEFALEQRKKFEVYKSLPSDKLYKRQTAVRYAAQNIRRENDESEKKLDALKYRIEEAKKQKEKVDDALEFLSVVRRRRFEDNIVLRIDGYQAIYIRDRSSWYCLMDDIPVMDQLPEDTVSVFFGEESRVVFLPYETEDPETGKPVSGVIAVSDRELESREKAESEDFAVRGKTAVFLRGKKYRMEVPDLGTVIVQLSK